MNNQGETIKRLEADIAVIKDAIRSNNGFVRRIIAAPVLGRFFVALGIACIVVPLAWEFALVRYGSLRVMPYPVTGLLVAGSAAVAVILAVWKTRAISRAARGIDARYTWWEVVRELSEHPVLIQQFLVVALTVFLSVVAGTTGNAHLVPAVIAGGIGVVFMLYSVAFLLTEYTFMTIWLFGYVALTVLVPDVSPLILTAIGYGGGFCVYGIYCSGRGRTPAPLSSGEQGSTGS